MSVRSARRRFTGDNTWPGFVDALSSLLLVIIFLLSVFVLAQFFMGQALSGRDAALEALRGQVAELGDLLRLEQSANDDLRRNVGQLSASLNSANLDRDQLMGRIADLESEMEVTSGRLAAALQAGSATQSSLDAMSDRYNLSQRELTSEQARTAAAIEEIRRMNANLVALREQIGRLEVALDASEARDEESQAVIANLGRRLNTALAGKVEELAQYRSEFFGRMRAIIEGRPGIAIEGDRFVFQSELLFGSGSADLGELGREELAVFAYNLLTITNTIPDELNWVLRVDGHTDRVPISTARYPSNWELSSARAIAVVKFLVDLGVPGEKLVAAGFGQFQPLDPANTPDAYRRNRRIEMRLTQR